MIRFLQRHYHAWVFRRAMRELDARIELRRRRHERTSDLLEVKRARVHQMLRGS